MRFVLSLGDRAMLSMLYSDAIELYTCAIAFCCSDPLYHFNRAHAFYRLHKYVEATEDAEKSIHIDPNFSKVYDLLGLIYCAQGKYHDAIDQGFVKALELDPGDESFTRNIQFAHQKLGDADTAQEDQVIS
ncbi:hypothetical protein IFM89_036998 [Coptis chinensis]|uniref:Uncharacterized protein n=1 Tax=Coptis chinensis TaxID=261450 RepID=A0A835HJT8_9MAGN|nr:hypothetical protein IFM89_036998 [Coptis chinensis]